MSLWRSILRWFGFQREARVQITAPGIEVTLAGDPNQVRALMGVIRTELERRARRDRRFNKPVDSQIVRPTELDEMDSPYALPEAVVLPVPDDEQPAEARRVRMIEMTSRESPTMPPSMSAGDVHLPTDPSLLLVPAQLEAEDLEMRTALTTPPKEAVMAADSLTPPVVQGLLSSSSTDLDTLEVERRNRETRPLHPSLKSEEG